MIKNLDAGNVIQTNAGEFWLLINDYYGNLCAVDMAAKCPVLKLDTDIAKEKIVAIYSDFSMQERREYRGE